MATTSEKSDSEDDCFTMTIFCGDHDADINIPYEASADEISTIIKETFGVRGSFLLQIKNYDDRIALKAEPLKSVYLHCSSIKAAALERYKDHVWEIRGSNYQRGGDALWYYQSQKLRPEDSRKLLEREMKPLDYPP
ncbi:uncharacterized protein LOC114524543 [Dendronephthya gigantea]|uniref:uncharacterized protein LOC114524543 n=1 Tax=Dendronephthya gigantea TaxID=151771 RepID=UPI00106C2C1B|nr:uncharacterized protein LOC114524543 [Dendronephthya gigantea]